LHADDASGLIYALKIE